METIHTQPLTYLLLFKNNLVLGGIYQSQGNLIAVFKHD